MLHLLLPVLAGLAPQDAWTALPLPDLCRESRASTHVTAPAGGVHVRLEEDTPLGRRGSRVLLQPNALTGLLQLTAGTAGRTLTFFPFTPPLLVQGGEADVAWARSALRGIEAAGARNRVTISAWLLPAAGASAPAAGGALPVGGRSWTGEAWAGEELVFGDRDRRGFVATYDVEVSTDSGVAAPVIGTILTGQSVHLRASRVAGGQRYHLRGVLDLAELEALETFDPDTPDLGEFLQPRVRSVNLSFSGVATSGELLRVELAGSPLEEPDWTLLVRVDTRAEPRGPAAAGAALGSEWRAIDVSLLERRAPVLEALDPGAGLDGEARLGTVTPQAATITASGVLSLVQQGSRARRSGSGSRASAVEAPVQVMEGLLLVTAETTANGLAERLAAFVRQVEAPRLASTSVEVRHGGLRARFPVAEGETARLLVGTERTLLIGYRSEIAPNTWMPSPIVERAYDGLAWQGRLSTGKLDAEAWTSSTTSIGLQSRDAAQVGAVQLPDRNVRGARAQVPVGERAELLQPLRDRPGLIVEVAGP